jgi:hypothetical protein
VGVEVLAWVFAFLLLLAGFFGSVVLLGLSLTASSRPYAIAVFVAACLFAAILNNIIGHDHDAPWNPLFIFYSLGVIVLGPISCAINRLVKWHRKRSAS